MIVTVTKLQRQITMHGCELLLKLSTDTAAALKRMDRQSREADSVTNLVTNLKAELNKFPSYEAEACAMEVKPDLAKVWMTALAMYTRAVSRIEKAAGQIEMTTDANTKEDAAQKIANQLQEQLNLPLESLDAIVSAQDKREAEERKKDAEFAKGAAPVPHRGKDVADEGLVPGGAPADLRNRRGPRPTPLAVVKGGKAAKDKAAE